jgi:hypothetical protein
MKTLQQHNREQNDIRDYLRIMKTRAHVLCDKCGTEMLYTDEAILACYPPKRNVHCPHCGTQGYKTL